MTRVTKIAWTVKTGDQSWSGTNTPVEVEIYRDQELLHRLHLEPGCTPRLDRSELLTYLWQAGSAAAGAKADRGAERAGYQEFPQGIGGHLRVRLIARGNDAWQKQWIESTVYSVVASPVPAADGETDGPAALEWLEQRQTFHFSRDLVLSSDPGEGVQAITLLYNG
jgi:hypothetical protein